MAQTQADLYGLTASGIDPEIAAQMLGTTRGRMVAQALLQQAMTPLQAQPTPAGGLAVPISPMEGIAQIVKAYMGKRGLDKADATQAQLATENTRRESAAMSDYLKLRNGTPSQAPTTPNDDEGNAMPPVAGTPGNPLQAAAMASVNPMLMNNALVKEDIKNAAGGEIQYHNAGNMLVGTDKRTGKVVSTVPIGESANNIANRTNLNANTVFTHGTPSADTMLKFQGLSAEQKATLGAHLGQFLATAKDTGISVPAQLTDLFNSVMGGQKPATPQAAPAGAIPPEVMAAAQSGKPFVATQADGQPPQFQPVPLQAMPQNAGSALPPAAQRSVQTDIAKKSAEEQLVNQQLDQKMTPAIKMARDLLDKGPTESGAGSLVDSVGKFFGVTVPGADHAGALKTLAGWMTSNVPRMQGPQSDKDTLLYKQMAGQVGDDTVPIAIRKAALDTLEGIRTAYRNGYSQGYMPPNQAGGAIKQAATVSSDAEYNALPSGATFMGPDGKLRRKP